MKYFEWNAGKNVLLKSERGLGFEEIVIAISEGKLLDILENPNKQKYPDQTIFIVEINGYAYLVPFVENSNAVFLKTIVPSRKATRDYLIKNAKE